MNRRLFAALIGSGLVGLLQSQGVPAQSLEPTTRLIVKMRDSASAATSPDALLPLLNANGRASFLRTLGTGGQLVQYNYSLSKEELQAVTDDLLRSGQVEYVEEDRLALGALIPNDPDFSAQWPLDTFDGIAMQRAWDLASGSGVIVAVIDSGYLPHAELTGRIVGGYDFIGDRDRSNDGGGRDNDARDPGSFSSSCRSGWHGTAMNGIIAANTHNGQGIASVTRSAQILPVRVLGKCLLGYESDIADGMIWASGGTVPGVPPNTHRARVLSVSIRIWGACSATTQAAINAARAAGAVIVVAAGNDSTDAPMSPASCIGVVPVAAVTRAGEKPDYSNFGAHIDLAAPGDAFTTYNNGVTTPMSDHYLWILGTSASAPYVAGVAALLLEMEPSLTNDDVRHTLRANTRAFPGTCVGCGTGILNATRAVLSLRNAPLTPGSITASTSESSGRYTITFQKSRGATQYVVQYSRNGGAWTGSRTIYEPGTSTTFNQTDGDYTHRVAACNPLGLCSTQRTGAPVQVCKNACP